MSNSYANSPSIGRRNSPPVHWANPKGGRLSCFSTRPGGSCPHRPPASLSQLSLRWPNVLFWLGCGEQPAVRGTWQWHFRRRSPTLDARPERSRRNPSCSSWGDAISLRSAMKFNFELSQNKSLKEFSFAPPFYITGVFFSLPVSLGFQFLYPTAVCSASGKIWGKELQMENTSPCFYPPLPPHALVKKKKKKCRSYISFSLSPDCFS